MKKTTVETQEIVSRSEGLAERLRFEMENRGETLSERRRAAEGGLTVGVVSQLLEDSTR